MSERLDSGRAILFLAALLGVGYLLHLLAPILTPFLVSLLLAYIGNPLVTRLQQHGVPRAVTTLLLFVLFFVVLLGLLLGIVPAIQKQIVQFSTNVPGYIDWLQFKVSEYTGTFVTLDFTSLRETLLAQWQDIGQWTAKALSYATASGMAMVGWVVNLLMVPIVTFYLLRDWHEIVADIGSAMSVRTRNRVAPLVREIDDALAGFLRGQLSVMVALGIVYSVGLWLVGVELALPIGLLSGLVSFVPYLGFIVGIIAASLAALVQFQDVLHLGLVLIVFMVGQGLESFVFTPYFVGDRIGLHPVVVIFAVMAGGQIFGFFGILLALPTAAALMVWARHMRRRARAKRSAPQT